MEIKKECLGKVAITIEKDYHNSNRAYDKLVIVEKEGAYKTYISRKAVPADTPITDREYWLPFSSLAEELQLDYNRYKSQLEIELRELKERFDSFSDINKKIIELIQEHIESVGKPNGIAQLDESGKVPAEQLPSYVDDVLEFNTIDNFPEVGESGKIYVDISTSRGYRWSGSTYIFVGNPLELGETNSTAYPGDKGKETADFISPLKNMRILAKKTDNVVTMSQNNNEIYLHLPILNLSNGTQTSQTIILSPANPNTGGLMNSNSYNALYSIINGAPILIGNRNSGEENNLFKVINGNLTFNFKTFPNYSNSTIENRNIIIPTATFDASGLLEAIDKKYINKVRESQPIVRYDDSGNSVVGVTTNNENVVLNFNYLDSTGCKPLDLTIPYATTDTAGVMSSADKVKLDNIGDTQLLTDKQKQILDNIDNYGIVFGSQSSNENIFQVFYYSDNLELGIYGYSASDPSTETRINNRVKLPLATEDNPGIISRATAKHIEATKSILEEIIIANNKSWIDNPDTKQGTCSFDFKTIVDGQIDVLTYCIDIPYAGVNTAGLMPLEDKIKLDSIDTSKLITTDKLYSQDEKYFADVRTFGNNESYTLTFETRYLPNKMKPSDPKVISLPIASSNLAGLMTSADKIKLDSINVSDIGGGNLTDEQVEDLSKIKEFENIDILYCENDIHPIFNRDANGVLSLQYPVKNIYGRNTSLFKIDVPVADGNVSGILSVYDYGLFSKAADLVVDRNVLCSNNIDDFNTVATSNSLTINLPYYNATTEVRLNHELNLPLATTTNAGIIDANDKATLNAADKAKRAQFVVFGNDALSLPNINISRTESSYQLNIPVVNINATGLIKQVDLPLASTTDSGIMSADDKSNLDKLKTFISNKNFYYRNDSNSINIIANRNNTGKCYLVAPNINVDGIANTTAVQIPEVSSTSNGLMSIADKTKLDSIDTQKIEDINNINTDILNAVVTIDSKLGMNTYVGAKNPNVLSGEKIIDVEYTTDGIDLIYKLVNANSDGTVVKRQPITTATNIQHGLMSSEDKINLETLITKVAQLEAKIAQLKGN